MHISWKYIRRRYNMLHVVQTSWLSSEILNMGKPMSVLGSGIQEQIRVQERLHFYEPTVN
jgi:hypothetical protein